MFFIDAALCAVQTLQDVVSMVQAARQAFGQARLTTATQSTEFMRVIFGDDESQIAAGGGYYCQECVTQPRLDYHWTVGEKCGCLSGWFCGQGCAYDTGRMAGLLTFADKNGPEGSFVMNTRMPIGVTANMLGVIKLVNLIRLGEVALSADDMRKAGGLGPACKSMLGKDNKRYLRVFHLLRGVARAAILKAPNLGPYYCPEIETCEGPNDVTFRTEDYGRGYVLYDIGKLFDGDEPAEASDGAWRGLLQTVVSAWGLAEAAALHPDELNAYTGISKQTIRSLRTWLFIRQMGCYAPEGDDASTMSEASVSDRSWAALPFNDF